MVTFKEIEEQMDAIGVAFILHTKTGTTYWLYDRNEHVCKPYWSHPLCKVSGNFIKAYDVSKLPKFKQAFIVGEDGRAEFEILNLEAAKALLASDTFSFANLFSRP